MAILLKINVPNKQFLFLKTYLLDQTKTLKLEKSESGQHQKLLWVFTHVNHLWYLSDKVIELECHQKMYFSHEKMVQKKKAFCISFFMVGEIYFFFFFSYLFFSKFIDLIIYHIHQEEIWKEKKYWNIFSLHLQGWIRIGRKQRVKGWRRQAIRPLKAYQNKFSST